MNYITISPTDKLNLLIPWEDNLMHKTMLLHQNGFWGTHNASDGLKILEKRLAHRMNSLWSVLDSLPANSTIVDIGAGNSLIDLFIQLCYKEKNFKFVLLDGDNSYPDEVNVDGNLYTPTFKPYNNWDFLDKAIQLNNFPPENFIKQDPYRPFEGPFEGSVDLIMSFASWCWHYPVDVYYDFVNKHLRTGGYLYINPVLNVPSALDKLSSLVNEVLKKQTYPLEFVASQEENKIMLDIVDKHGIDKNKHHVLFSGRR